MLYQNTTGKPFAFNFHSGDASRHAPSECDECGTLFAVKVAWEVKAVVVTPNNELSGRAMP